MPVLAPLVVTLVSLVMSVAAPIAVARAAEPSLAARDAWVRATPGATAVSSSSMGRHTGGHAGQGDVTAAYLVLENRGGETDRLVAVASPVARRVELHESRVVDGVMRMRPVEGIRIPAGGSVRLEPGGLHLMLMGLHEPIAEGRRVPLTLTFESGATLSVDAEARAR